MKRRSVVPSTRIAPTPALLLQWPANPGPADLESVVASVLEEHIIDKPCNTDTQVLAWVLVKQVVESYSEARALHLARQAIEKAKASLGKA